MAKADLIGNATQFISGLNDNPDLLSLLGSEGFTSENLSLGQTKLQGVEAAQTAKTSGEGKMASSKTERDET